MSKQISETLNAEQMIRVVFPQPINGQLEYYFGSLAAMYEMFDEEQIGCKLTTLQAARFAYKATRKCTITKLQLFRKRQVNRRNKNLVFSC